MSGVTVREPGRQKYENAFLRRAKSRYAQGKQGDTDPSAPEPAQLDVQGFIKQTREPQFISSAYFLRFKFEPGRYAVVGREQIDGRDVLKVEYYPANMFSGDPKTRTEHRVRQAADSKSDKSWDEQMDRLMNKVSLVTLWVEPAQHQIVKFTFDNAGLDFLPLAWLARIGELKASMVMNEAFPGIWLPKRVDTTGAMLLASGRLDIRYGLDYSGYREATVTTKIRSGAVR